MSEWKAKENPWEPPQYDEMVVYAIRAIASGTASDGQQKLFWKWLQYACGANDISFRPGEGGERATSFAEGKRFVGQQVQKFLNPAFTPPAMNVVEAPKPKRAKKKRR